MDIDLRYSHEPLPPPPPAEHYTYAPKSKGRWITLLAVILLIGIGIGWAAPRWGKSMWQKVSLDASRGIGASPSGYEAVFLTNGQIYFGKVQDEKADPIVIRDVYYLQVTQQLQPAPNPSESPEPVSQISLVKLGNELHGPTNEMYITRSQVLYIENLKDDSEVVRAIRESAKK